MSIAEAQTWARHYRAEVRIIRKTIKWGHTPAQEDLNACAEAKRNLFAELCR